MITKPTKYTPEFVLQEVKSILSEVREDQNVYYLWQVFEKREYSLQRFSEWSNTFSLDEEISETIKKIKEILETRVVVGAMKKELHVTMTIFHLKNNYKWTDKTVEPWTDGRPIPILWNAKGESRLSEMEESELLALIK